MGGTGYQPVTEAHTRAGSPCHVKEGMSHATIQAHALAGGAKTSFNRSTLPTEHDRIIQQTQKWVAQTFFGTLLKQLRESPFRSPLFEGGRGGEAFGALYDQRLADHMARGAGSKLVNAIASRIEANRAYGKSARRLPRRKTPHGINPAGEGRNRVPPALRA